MQAFMAGRIKVQGDLTKLMLLQSVTPDERTRTVAAQLKAITA
jgi:putative sterol carrier protein